MKKINIIFLVAAIIAMAAFEIVFFGNINIAVARVLFLVAGGLSLLFLITRGLLWLRYRNSYID